MTSFGWKRKAGDNVSRSVSSAFEQESRGEEDADVESGLVDWIGLGPKPTKMMCLEDATIKSERLKQEGATLAEADRPWEATKKWDQALQLTPSDETLYEMKAQAYMQLNEVLPALNAAEKVTEMKPRWWVGHQTLGRAQLGLGEVRLALKSFSRAVHLYPEDKSLWEDDLFSAVDLLQKKLAMERATLEAIRKEEEMCAAKIVELDSEGRCMDLQALSAADPVLDMLSETSDSNNTDNSASEKTLKSLPQNYIYMRN